ncbi:MAG: PaaI family thioesterase [Spirochaetaceae bacterium]|nr:MAG: PaaI family thioesterase [Spirochaetaceae bacterium]
MSTQARKVRNPYAGIGEYNCFGCDPNNAAGLRLEFFLEGETVTSIWSPRRELEGYPGVIHGGIQATLADEIGGWYVHAVLGTAGMTRDLSISYHEPARSEDGPFRLEARADTSLSNARTAVIDVTISGAGGTLFSTTRVTYAVFSEGVAKKRLHFPGREAFLPEE